MLREKYIIPIASGKGGVGKSIFTANLSVILASSEYETVAVDLDLGGSNLYSYLGLSNEHPGIGDYVREKKQLHNYLVQTNIPQLQFLPGEGRTAFLANIHHAQKIKLLRELRNLQAQYIFLDLGAGTTFNTLDYFGLTNNGIIVTTFDLPALKNTLTFLKNFIFRVVNRNLPKSTAISKAVNNILKNSSQSNPLTINKLIDIIDKDSHEIAAKISEVCELYRPRIIFNMGKDADNLKILHDYNNAIKTNLSINAEFFGFVFEDENIPRSVKENTIFQLQYSESIAAKCLKHIARRIIKFKDQPIYDSIERLSEDTHTIQEKWLIGQS